MEQYTGITKFAPEIDVYALGATLYFCLTNSNPPKAFDISSNETLLAKLPKGISQRVKDAIVNAMQRSSFDRTRSAQAFLSSVEQIYTLPVGTELRSLTQKYQIVEVLGETSLYIKYKAVLSNGTNTNHTDALTGDETTVLVQYYIFEWFEKDKDKRIDSTSLQKQNFRDLNSEYITVFANEMHKLIPNSFFAEKDAHGRCKAEEFKANNTYYYSSVIIPKTSTWKVLVDFLRNVYNEILKEIKRNVRLLLLLGIFIFTIVVVIGSLKMLNRLSVYALGYAKEKTKQEVPIHKEKETPQKTSTKVKTDTIKGRIKAESQPQPVEPIKKEKTDDELFGEAKTISDFKALADRGYKKAYYPLANKYFVNGYNKDAEKWANKCVSMNVNVPLATSLLKKIERINVQKALSEKDWTVMKKYADKGCQSTYAPLAEYYLKIGQYELAAKYARKGVDDIGVGSNPQRAKAVLDILNKMDYNDSQVYSRYGAR